MATYSTERHGAGVTAELFRFIEGGVKDAHGNRTDAWETVPDILEGCAFDPGYSDELRTPGLVRVIDEPKLFGPYDSPAGPKDKIKVEGKTFEVEGEVRRWKSPFTGRKIGAAIGLRLVSG